MTGKKALLNQKYSDIIHYLVAESQNIDVYINVSKCEEYFLKIINKDNRAIRGNITIEFLKSAQFIVNNTIDVKYGNIVLDYKDSKPKYLIIYNPDKHNQWAIKLFVSFPSVLPLMLRIFVLLIPSICYIYHLVSYLYQRLSENKEKKE